MIKDNDTEISVDSQLNNETPELSVADQLVVNLRRVMNDPNAQAEIMGITGISTYDNEVLTQDIKKKLTKEFGKPVWLLYQKTVAAHLAKVQQDSGDSSNKVVKQLIKCPCPETLEIPAGYSYNENRFLIGPGEKIVCRVPIIPTEILTDQDGHQNIKLIWMAPTPIVLRDGEVQICHQWHEEIFPREKLATREIVSALSPRGIPVDSENCSDVISYLTAAILQDMPHAKSVDQCGWIDQDTFLLGKETLGKQSIRFSGELSQVKQLRSQGDLSRWIEVVNQVTQSHPIAATILYGSFAAPLLELLGVTESFFIHSNVDTGKGKTTALKLAASVWGERFYSNWKSTVVGLERRTSLFKDLPIIIDESANASPEFVSSAVFQICEGKDKLRGTKDAGFRAQRSWKTVAISSGEADLISETALEGMTGRVLTLQGAPLEGDQPILAASILGLVDNHYGTAGKAFIEFLIANIDKKDQWKARHAELRNTMLANLKGKTKHRRAIQLATMAVAGELAHEALGLLGDPAGNLSIISSTSLKDPGSDNNDDYARRTVDIITDYVKSHPAQFEGEGTHDQYGGQACYGRIDSDKYKITPSKVREILVQRDFNPGQAIDKWVALGWVTKNVQAKVSRLNQKLWQFNLDKINE